uniref:Legume lectin domain-containing protein n=1 Tax=Kalanchoe fedtschenkoi TaxID=63787 RepID=A0A7N0TH22_KALFE
MAVFNFSIHTASFCLIALFLILFSNPILILSSGTLDTTPTHTTATTNPNFFDSQISLYGDAALVDGGSSISLTSSSVSSYGMVMYEKPLKFLESNPRNGVSFTAHFSFSISGDKGDGIVFLIAPKDLASKFPGKDKFGITRDVRFFGVEFDTSMDGNVGDSNVNHVGIVVNNLASSSIVNVSGANLVLNSGKKLQSWIDYDASSKRIEVRLSELGTARPYDPLLGYSVDLGQLWKDEEVFVGISSSSGNSKQKSNLYSGRFVVRDVPSSLHSQPIDPSSIKEADQSSKRDGEQKNSFCPLSILAGLIFTTGCGALAAFVVLFLWVVFVDRHRIIPAEPDFKYENINVVVEKDMDDAKNLLNGNA